MNTRQALQLAKKLFGPDGAVAHVRGKPFKRKERFGVGILVEREKAKKGQPAKKDLSIIGASHVSWEGAFVDAHQYLEKAQKRAAELAAEKERAP